MIQIANPRWNVQGQLYREGKKLICKIGSCRIIELVC